MCSDELLNQIETLRQQLNNTVKSKGYTDEETIHISQQLDYVLNVYRSRGRMTLNYSDKNHSLSSLGKSLKHD